MATDSSILAWKTPQRNFQRQEVRGAWQTTVQEVAESGTTSAAAAAKSLQSCPTLCDPIDGSPPGPPRPWDSPGKNTGVGCHFLLQCMKVKSEREVAQQCLTLCDPMDCSPPGSSVHGTFQARVQLSTIQIGTNPEENNVSKSIQTQSTQDL